MPKNLSDSTNRVLVLAQQEARNFQHAYVGTEHLLLGLLLEGSDTTCGVLVTMGISAARVRDEIEKVVTRGTESTLPAQLLLTPRSRKVIDYAREEAAAVQQKFVSPEHLFLGLFREPDGVAAKVLLNLGLKLPDIRAGVLKIRIWQMKIVERAVRPVRAGQGRKLKMREELLAHFTAIYEEENARLHNPADAMYETQRRFGDLAVLAGELQSALRWYERIEPPFVWRAPETAARYMFRVAVQVSLIAAAVSVLLAAMFLARFGLTRSAWLAARPLVGGIFFLPLIMYLMGLFYFCVRDAMFGPQWARKSALRVFVFELLIAAVVAVTSLGYFAFASGESVFSIRSVLSSCSCGLVAAGVILLNAKLRGPSEIAHTVWSCLDLSTPG
jgi:hypothetical protein